MKKIHLASLIAGLLLGLLIASGIPSLRTLHAEDDSIPRVEVDKKLEEILTSQETLKKRIATIVEQTQFLKASSGK